MDVESNIGVVSERLFVWYANQDDTDQRCWRTEGKPAGRIGTPDKVAEAVLWLCSYAVSFVT